MKAWAKKVGKKLRPDIQKPSDAIIQMRRITIFRTDSHTLKSGVSSFEAGRTLGHEG